MVSSSRDPKEEEDDDDDVARIELILGLIGPLIREEVVLVLGMGMEQVKNWMIEEEEEEEEDEGLKGEREDERVRVFGNAIITAVFRLI